MNHEQAMLMKSSRVSDLNTPWEQVLHLASRRVFPKRHTIDVSNTEPPYFYYILSGTVRLAYVGANGEERTILYAGAGTLVPITGFANAVASPAIDFRAEGIVTGTAVKMFTVAGPVIVFGTAASVVYGLVLYLLA